MLKRVAGRIERYWKDRPAIRNGDPVLVCGHPGACLVACAAREPVRVGNQAPRPPAWRPASPLRGT